MNKNMKTEKDNTQITVLGTPYQVKFGTPSDYPDALTDNDGVADHSVRKIFVKDLTESQGKKGMLRNQAEYQRHVIRHEIVHVFLDESGLRGSCDWVRIGGEEMVDWLANMIPKINEILKQLEALK